MWKKITEKRIEKLVEHYAPFLGLGHWSYEIIMKDRGSQGQDMEVDYAPTLEHFKLYVYKGHIERVNKREGWDLEQDVSVTILHELLHVMWCPFEGHITFPSSEIEASYRWSQEPILERLARTLYEHLPKAG